MKLSFELARSANLARTAQTGASLRPVMPTMTPQHMEMFRAFQEAAGDARKLVDKLNRSYAAAASDNYTADFRGTYGAPNAEILTSEYVVAARARTVAKDTPHGKAVVRAFQDNVVGSDPFKLEMKVGKFDAEGKFIEESVINRAVEAGWKEYCKAKSFTVRGNMSMMESMRMVEAERVTVGSVLARHYEGFPHNDFGYAVDFLEKDRLQGSYMGRDAMTGDPIRFSIARHPVYNFATAYWLLTTHPGDVFGNYATNRNGDRYYRERVPAEEIVHFNNLRDRAEQDIGMSELDATLLPLHRIHQYEKALMLASIASAAKPFWLEKETPNGFVIPDGLKEQVMNSPGLASDGAGTGNGTDAASAQNEAGTTPVHAVRPGERETFPAGFKLKQADPKFPIEGAHEFRLDATRDIAIGVGVSYQHASGDFQNLGFIAGLMCQVPFQELCKIRQNSLVDGGLDEIFSRWLKNAISFGYFERFHNLSIPISRHRELLTCAHFKGRGFPFVNPVVQAQALILLHSNGHLTRQQVQDALPQGMSVEKLAAELRNEQDEFSDIVLSAQGDMTRPNAEDVGEEPAAPAKSKPANPLRARARGGIDPMTQVALEMSVNGEH